MEIAKINQYILIIKHQKYHKIIILSILILEDNKIVKLMKIIQIKAVKRNNYKNKSIKNLINYLNV